MAEGLTLSSMAATPASESRGPTGGEAAAEEPELDLGLNSIQRRSRSEIWRDSTTTDHRRGAAMGEGAGEGQGKVDAAARVARRGGGGRWVRPRAL